MFCCHWVDKNKILREWLTLKRVTFNYHLVWSINFNFHGTLKKYCITKYTHIIDSNLSKEREKDIITPNMDHRSRLYISRLAPHVALIRFWILDINLSWKSFSGNAESWVLHINLINQCQFQSRNKLAVIMKKIPETKQAGLKDDNDDKIKGKIDFIVNK